MKVDWFVVGQNILLLIVGAVTAWNAWRSSKNASTLNKVHVLVNHQMELQKKALAEVTTAKYLLSKDPSDKAAADAAVADYLKHVERQSVVDRGD